MEQKANIVEVFRNSELEQRAFLEQKVLLEQKVRQTKEVRHALARTKGLAGIILEGSPWKQTEDNNTNYIS